MSISINGLDPASRLAVRWMFLRLGVLVGIWSLPWLLGGISFAQMLQMLSSVFTFTSALALILAKVRRERPLAVSLNTWDEAIAFSGLGLFAHGLHRLIY